MNVYRMVKELKRLNGLDDTSIKVDTRYFNVIIYDGNPSELILPKGFYYSRISGITRKRARVQEMYANYRVRKTE